MHGRLGWPYSARPRGGRRAVEVLRAVTEEVPTLGTTVTGVDEVQRLTVTGSPVVNQVQTVTTYAAPQDEVQSITSSGNVPIGAKRAVESRYRSKLGT